MTGYIINWQVCLRFFALKALYLPQSSPTGLVRRADFLNHPIQYEFEAIRCPPV